MFFIIGVTQKEKPLDFRQNLTCPACGRYGAVEVFMVFTVLTLFFIPVFRWNKRYYVKLSCCGGVAEIDKATGEGIEKGRIFEIDTSKMHFDCFNRVGFKKVCPECGYGTAEDFAFCPKCGRKFSK